MGLHAARGCMKAAEGKKYESAVGAQLWGSQGTVTFVRVALVTAGASCPIAPMPRCVFYSCLLFGTLLYQSQRWIRTCRRLYYCQDRPWLEDALSGENATGKRSFETVLEYITLSLSLIHI